MKTMFRVSISRPITMLGYNIYIYYRGSDNNYHIGYVDKDRQLRYDKKGLSPFELAPDPTIRIEEDDFLQSLADALGEINIYPQETNKDKIKAEAIADERKEQIEYNRKIIEKMIFE